LCGAFNTNLLAEAEKYVESELEKNVEKEFEMIAVGKKAARFGRKPELELIEVYDKLPEEPELSDVTPIIRTMIEKFVNGEVSKLSIAYMKFVSSLKQSPKVIDILPFESLKQEGDAESAIGEEPGPNQVEFKLEPDKDRVVDYALNRVIEAQIYQTFLESAASEHSSRMIAMKNASDAATDMIDNLTMEYNKSRQAAITQEIAEIAGAAAAIEDEEEKF
jgi:F-type H+-transporting ATPase subunit gamma